MKINILKFFRFTEGLPDIVKPIPPSTVEAYEHSREIRLPEELDDLLADPDEMRMQALLIRERILGKFAHNVSYLVVLLTNIVHQ